jgi:hypothetical protein
MTSPYTEALPHPAPEADDPARTQPARASAESRTNTDSAHTDNIGIAAEHNRTAADLGAAATEREHPEPDTTNSDAAPGSALGTAAGMPPCCTVPGSAPSTEAGVPPCCTVPGSASSTETGVPPCWPSRCVLSAAESAAGDASVRGDLPQVDAPHMEAFLQRYMAPGVPVVLSGLVDHWPALTRCGAAPAHSITM